MRINPYTNFKLLILIFIPTAFLFMSCNNWTVPPNLSGQWHTGKHNITVRTEPQRMKFEFTSDSASLAIKINSDKTVSGNIGLATFENGTLEKNWPAPKDKGIAYIIKSGKVGKIFESDPLDKKELEIWLFPVKDSMEAELRYTSGMAVFPMAGLMFFKVYVFKPK